jgi:ABC-type antimicrobial peptide transport system, permease component
MRNILKSIYRNFSRKPVTNLINLGGLALSLSLVIVLAVYAYSELTTDHFHKNGGRVYLYSESGNLPRIYTPGVLKDAIDQNIPEVESTLRIAGTWEAPVFQAENQEPITSDLLFTDPSFFTFFSYKAVEGNPEAALSEPLTVVITKSLAGKLFGKQSAIGKTLKLNNEKTLTVKAVIEEPKANTSLSFSALTSMATRQIVMPNEAEFKVWPFCLFQTFVLLKEGTNPEAVEPKIAALFPPDMKTKKSEARLTPFNKLYFTQFSLFNANYLRCGDRTKVMILLLVAALVLIIALVNFVNISSSQWVERMHQIGTMKIAGANRFSILSKVIAETYLFFLFAVFLAMVLIALFISSIVSYTGIHFNLNYIFSIQFIGISVVGTFILSLLFSLIPALRLSNSKVIDNLRKGITKPSQKQTSSSILVTTQFAIAIVLIAFTILIQKQVDFGSSNLGINQVNIVGLKLTPELMAKKDVLKKMTAENPNVKQTSYAQYFPGEIVSYWETKIAGSEERPIFYDTFNADANFFKTAGLELIQGRLYSDDRTTDANKVVVNESFIRENKLQNPLGTKFMSMNGSVLEIVGVIRDFHYKSYNKPIIPLAIRNEPFSTYCLVNLQTGNYKALNQAVQDIQAKAKSLSPSFPIEINFFDQAVQQMYQSELQFRRTFSLFAFSAIVICCMGILAMSMFACQRRIKEIGIRKVNGAKVREVMTMLNRDFVKWVLVAFVVATPVSWYIMNKWLEGFAYKTELNWWIFALSGIMALGIALLTVSWQSWKAATRNPVEALRYE